MKVNTAKLVKLSFIAGIYRRVCQMSTVGINVLHNIFVVKYFFYHFQIIYQGAIAHVAYEYFQMLTNYSILKKEKFR